MPDSPLATRLLALIADSEATSGEEFLLALRKNSSATPSTEVELGRLDWSPKKNWVEEEGGLPKYIEDVAIGIMKGSGYTREQAIPMAINRIKRWAAGLDNVKPDTVAKAVAALAKWEKMKISAKARK